MLVNYVRVSWGLWIIIIQTVLHNRAGKATDQIIKDIYHLKNGYFDGRAALNCGPAFFIIVKPNSHIGCGNEGCGNWIYNFMGSVLRGIYGVNYGI